MTRHYNKAILATLLAGALAACTTTGQQAGQETPEQRAVRELTESVRDSKLKTIQLEAQIATLQSAVAEARIPNTPSAIARIDSTISGLRHEFDLTLVRLTTEEDVRRANIAIIDSAAKLQTDLDRRYSNGVNAAYRDSLLILTAAKKEDIAPILSALSIRSDELASGYRDLGSQVQQLRKGALVRAPRWIAQNPEQYQRDVTQSYNSVKTRIDSYGIAEPVSPIAFAQALTQLRTTHLDYADQMTRALGTQEERITRDIDDLEFSLLYQLVLEGISTDQAITDVYSQLGLELDAESRARITGERDLRTYADRQVRDGVAPIASRATTVEGRAGTLEGSVTDLQARVGKLENAPPVQANPAQIAGNSEPTIPLTDEQKVLRGMMSRQEYNRLHR